jgi:hypothetical protein
LWNNYHENVAANGYRGFPWLLEWSPMVSRLMDMSII